MLTPLFHRIEEPYNRRRLLQILGAGLDAAARTLVEPHIRRMGGRNCSALWDAWG